MVAGNYWAKKLDFFAMDHSFQVWLDVFYPVRRSAARGAPERVSVPPGCEPAGIAMGDWQDGEYERAWGCLITTGGDVCCFGAEDVAPEVAPVPGVRDIVDISIGDELACGVTIAGSATCWTPDNKLFLAEPTGSEGVRQLSVVSRGTWCALTRERTVHCKWDGKPLTLPVRDVTAVETFGSGAYAVETDRTIRFWGHRWPEGALVSAEVVGVRDVDRLSAGSGCAVEAGGRLVCWGHVASPGCDVIALPMDDSRDYVDVASDCALDREGTVLCWGANRWGELGQSGTPSRATPMRIEALPAVRQIARGIATICAITLDHQLFCWGRRKKP